MSGYGPRNIGILRLEYELGLYAVLLDGRREKIAADIGFQTRRRYEPDRSAHVLYDDARGRRPGIRGDSGVDADVVQIEIGAPALHDYAHIGAASAEGVRTRPVDEHHGVFGGAGNIVVLPGDQRFRMPDPDVLEPGRGVFVHIGVTSSKKQRRRQKGAAESKSQRARGGRHAALSFQGCCRHRDKPLGTSFILS